MTQNFNRVPRNEAELVEAILKLASETENCKNIRIYSEELTAADVYMYSIVKADADRAVRALKLSCKLVGREKQKLELRAKLTAKRLENFLLGFVLAQAVVDIEAA